MTAAQKVAIVTGAASGIGAATTELLAAQHITVYAADIAYTEPTTVSDYIHHRRLDVADLGSWTTLTDEIANTVGGLDILINNAGLVGSYDTITDIAVEAWQAIIAVNQTGPFYGMRSCIPLMRARGGGSIVNVSSIWGLVGAAGVAAYQASKGAVTTMSKNAAVTYAPDGIRVNSVHPGLIVTPMTSAQDQAISDSIIAVTPMGRAGRPEEVAAAIAFLAGDGASYITGAQLTVDGGYTTP
jgi:NAD(P)-dependent dehydrogenase (short-subunit alcohol dehydrogenase family)